jgi:hypothetical protein
MRTLNPLVVGSNPTGPTNQSLKNNGLHSLQAVLLWVVLNAGPLLPTGWWFMPAFWELTCACCGKITCRSSFAQQAERPGVVLTQVHTQTLEALESASRWPTDARVHGGIRDGKASATTLPG